MKKLFLITGLLSFSITSFSQSQNWWKSDGTNTGSASTFVGTSNNFALKFKSNNIEWFSISPSGIYKFNSLNGSTNGILGVNSSGELFRTNLTGNANDVFRGDGTFGSISSLSGWFFDGNVIFSDGSKNIGIGTNIAPEKLSVNGNIVANGSISGTSLNVIDIVGAGKEFKILNSLCLKGVDANVPGSRNMICGLNGDLYVQSTNANYNTIINYGNVGKVGIGLIPTEDFHVGVKARFDQDIFTKRIVTNRITSEDSLIAFGDSSIYLSSLYNQIYGSSNTLMKGLGLGVQTFSAGLNSTAIGKRVRANGANSIVIGRTDVSSSSMLVNSIDNSLMIGFNSDIPTLTVLAASGGNGSTGYVGIGTSNPNAKLTVHTEAGPQGAYGILSTSNSPTVKSISVIHKDPLNLIDQENFIVYTDGRVYCREVFVKLGQLGDFVFDEDYDLMTYHELENYLKQNHHLPGVPSEPEVLNGGLNVGEMQAKVLQKTEENTLYILDLNKRLEKSQIENEKLKSDLEEMKKKQIELEKNMIELLNKK